MSSLPTMNPISRESLVHQLYEAAELEHNLMCTYLYAAFSLKSGTEEGLSAVGSRCHRALAARHPARGHRGDGTPHRGVEHHRGARRQSALRAD